MGINSQLSIIQNSDDYAVGIIESVIENMGEGFCDPKPKDKLASSCVFVALPLCPHFT